MADNGGLDTYTQVLVAGQAETAMHTTGGIPAHADALLGTGDGHDLLALGKYLGECELPRRTALGVGYGADLVDKL